MNDNAQERLDRIITSFDTAMLVTTSLSGGARIEPDAQMAREQWQPAMKLWFP